jgi:hypothetical protein
VQMPLEALHASPISAKRPVCAGSPGMSRTSTSVISTCRPSSPIFRTLVRISGPVPSSGLS